MVKHGLVLGEIQDWAEQALHDQKGFSERLANRLGPERASPLHLCEPCAAGLAGDRFPVEEEVASGNLEEALTPDLWGVLGNWHSDRDLAPIAHSIRWTLTKILL